MPESEIIRPAPVADATWKPVWLEDRQAWICRRMMQGIVEGRPVLQMETWGARMNGGNFSPFYIFEEASAKRQCDTLNDETHG